MTTSAAFALVVERRGGHVHVGWPGEGGASQEQVVHYGLTIVLCARFVVGGDACAHVVLVAHLVHKRRVSGLGDQRYLEGSPSLNGRQLNKEPQHGARGRTKDVA